MRPTSRMREVIAPPVCTFAPGVADALAAGIVARKEFEAAYTVSSGASLTRPGHVRREARSCCPDDGGQTPPL